MDESFTTGGFTASQGGSTTNAPESKEGIAPLVIQQILNLGEGGIKIFGFTYGVISLVAIVRSIDHTSTRVVYKLEDHTGSIEAHYWVDEGKADLTEPVELNKYARAFGMVKMVGGNKILTLFKIRPTKSVNEVTTHLLEMMHARFQAEKYQRMMEGGGEATTSTAMDVDQANDSNFCNGLKGKQLLLYKAIKGHASEEGISCTELHEKFKHIPLPEIRQLTEAMSLEGHIYSSIDPDHFLPTE